MYKALVVYVWGIVDSDLVLFVMIVFLHSLFSHSQISTLNTRLSCPHIYSQYNSTYWRHVKTVFTLLPTSWNAGHLFTRVSFHSMCCVSDYSEHVVTGSPTLSLIQSMASSHSRRYCTSFWACSRRMPFSLVFSSSRSHRRCSSSKRVCFHGNTRRRTRDAAVRRKDGRNEEMAIIDIVWMTPGGRNKNKWGRNSEVEADLAKFTQ